jgi:hypothetical protein
MSTLAGKNHSRTKARTTETKEKQICPLFITRKSRDIESLWLLPDILNGAH